MIGRAEARSFLSGKPVGLLWGVGKAIQKRLAQDGITRIGELARIGEAELVARYGKLGRRLWSCARGEDDRPVDPDREARSMSSEITLDDDTADPDRLRQILWQLAETVARRMKKAGVAGRSVTLKLKTAEFRTITRSRHLSSATRSAEEMFLAAEPLLACEADGRAFRLVGIGAHDLVEGGQVVQGGPLWRRCGRQQDRPGAGRRAGQVRRRRHRQRPRLRLEAQAARAVEGGVTRQTRAHTDRRPTHGHRRLPPCRRRTNGWAPRELAVRIVRSRRIPPST